MECKELLQRLTLNIYSTYIDFILWFLEQKEQLFLSEIPFYNRISQQKKDVFINTVT